MPNLKHQNTLPAPVHAHRNRHANPSVRNASVPRLSTARSECQRGRHDPLPSEGPRKWCACQKANAHGQHELLEKVPLPIPCLRVPRIENETASPETGPRRSRGGQESPWAAPLLIGLTSLLASCGGEYGPEVRDDRGLPLQTAVHAHQAPLVDLGDRLHVGADVAAADDDLPVVAVHGSADVSHGTVRDGIGAAEIIAYLRADAASYLYPGRRRR